MVLTNNWNPNRYVAWLAFNDTTAEHSVAIYKRAKLILTDDHINSLIYEKLDGFEITGSTVHIGADEPTDENINLWVDTDEEAGGSFEESDPTVPAWAKAESKPTYTAEEVGALPVGTEIPSDAHINSLIDAKLGVIENGSY